MKIYDKQSKHFHAIFFIWLCCTQSKSSELLCETIIATIHMVVTSTGEAAYSRKMSTISTRLQRWPRSRSDVTDSKMTMTAFGIFWNIHALQSWLGWPRCQRWPWPPFETVRNRGLRSSRQMNRQRGFSRCIIFKIFGVPSPSSSWSSSPSSWSSISINIMNRQQQVPVLHNIQHIWPPFQALGED